METQKKASEWNRLNREQRASVTAEMVEKLMEQFVTPELWSSFVHRNKAEFRKIAEGQVSKAFVLYAKQNNRPYKARVKGLLTKSTSEGEKFTLDLVFEQRELIIPKEINIRGGADSISISEKQIATLMANGELDELLLSKNGAKYFAAIDTDLKRLAIADAKFVRTPKTLHGTSLSEEQTKNLTEGKAVEYERENPENKQELLIFKARYNPIYYSIRSEQVFDQNGRAITKPVTQEQIKVSEALKAVETEIERTQKAGKTKTPRLQR